MRWTVPRGNTVRIGMGSARARSSQSRPSSSSSTTSCACQPGRWARCTRCACCCSCGGTASSRTRGNGRSLRAGSTPARQQRRRRDATIEETGWDPDRSAATDQRAERPSLPLLRRHPQSHVGKPTDPGEAEVKWVPVDHIATDRQGQRDARRPLRTAVLYASRRISTDARRCPFDVSRARLARHWSMASWWSTRGAG